VRKATFFHPAQSLLIFVCDTGASTNLPYYPPQAASASAAAAGSSGAAGYGYTTQDMYRRASENTAYGPYSQLTQAQQNSLRASTSRLGSISYPGTAFPSRSHAYDFMATPMRPSMSQPRMTYPSFPNIDFNTSGGSARLSYGGPYEPTSLACPRAHPPCLGTSNRLTLCQLVRTLHLTKAARRVRRSRPALPPSTGMKLVTSTIFLW
jgi:hypothetical protein